jgi:purine-binding chemotaxis protein CheW
MNAAVRTRSAADILVDNLSSEQFLTFEIGSELFAIPILAVQEIRGWEKVSHIPRTEAHVLGVINLRGTVVPVLDVRTRLGMESRAVTATTVVIVVRIETPAHEKTTVGCVVDAVSDVATIGADQIRPAPSACGSVDSHFIRGVASIDQRLVLLLDIARLIEQSTAGDGTGHGPVDEAAIAAGASLFDRIGGSAAVDAAIDRC